MSEDIVSGNKLIIESPFVSDVHKKWREEAIKAGESFYNERLLPELKYHTSWDWLHSVWDKFSRLPIKEDGDDDEYNETFNRHLQAISTAIIHYKIEVAFHRLIRGIQWYNTQNKTGG